MTKALNCVLGGENDTYRGIRTVEFIPSQELTGSGKNPQSVGYLYTGVLLIRDSMIIPDVTKDDFVVKVGVPPRTTKRIIDRFCERTGIDPKNVYVSQSTAHASIALRPETVEDFNKETQRCVKPVRVPTAASTTSSAVVETTETMFLPSEAEVFGRAVKMRVVEGEAVRVVCDARSGSVSREGRSGLLQLVVAALPA